ncbi:putative signal peptide-containing and transmembrane domain-containing protein [Cryptosporidium canis]|uniref:Signal peptide-containing and transmembrane domain-containing protein n=1 Tax=Cryptosporidium canis TaxID=195482 RepID=A0ABQ8PAI2_9CRYT|nr:putative signal peptide-containing and transmembrane domain-containing protein [Cryptosporidium canis]
MVLLKCLKRQKRVVFMIIFLLVIYYVYVRSHITSANKSSGHLWSLGETSSGYSSGFFEIDWLGRPTLVSKFTDLLPFFNLRGIRGLLSNGNLSGKSDKPSGQSGKGCRYLWMVLDPSDLPVECVPGESGKSRLDGVDSSAMIREYELSNSPWRQELYRRFLARVDSTHEFGELASFLSVGDDLVGGLAGVQERRFPVGAGEDYLSRLLDMSLDLRFSDKRCEQSVNIKRLWEFGRRYCKLSRSDGSAVCGDSKYYSEFLALVYYKCIYGLELSSGAFAASSDGRTDLSDSFFESVACYQLTPVSGIGDGDLASLGGLCEWEFERKAFYSQCRIDQERMQLIRLHIKQIDEIYSKLDIVRLNSKYEQGVARAEVVEDIKASYFNQLRLLVRRVGRQVMAHYTYLAEEVGSFVDPPRQTGPTPAQAKTQGGSKNSQMVVPSDAPHVYTHLKQQDSESFNWKQLASSIIDNTQNILVREHINTMLINFLFDTIIGMLNPWVSLFYQASFIINSYLSIISFLLVIVAILVCFNTIPCFRNEKDEEKSKKISAKILRIYKANAMVLLLNIIFILGGLLRYLYLPNEMEFLNTNIAIIKAVNKVLNIILCPCVVNIITSFSTVFSIFQWQLLWVGRKLSLSSLINL